MTRKKAAPLKATPRKPAPIDEWERQWRRHWSKVGTPGYELPADRSGGDERDFLANARTPAGERRRLKRINDEFGAAFRTLYPVGPAVTIFGSARFGEDHEYYKLARKTGAELARAGFAVLTGGGPGIMEAANRGAYEAGGQSVGLNIILPHEQGENPYLTRGMEFRYFFTRKVCLVKYSCAFIVMPGGLGTLDEMFEAATLIQCGKIGPFPIVLMGGKFWKGLQTWGKHMVKQGVYRQEELGFGRVTDSPAEAVDLVLRTLPKALKKRLNPID